MKKTLMITLVIFLTVQVIVSFRPELFVYFSVDEIKITNNENIYEYYNYYGVPPEKSQKNIDEVCVRIKIFNGRLNKLKNVNFEVQGDESDIIISNKIDTKLPWNINIKPLTAREVDVYFLIDAGKYSNQEIIEKLESTEIHINSENITKVIPLK